MIVHYAKSYIDALYESKDIVALHGVIDVVCNNRELPEQFWLFRRLRTWYCSGRSGIWQYYESVPADELEKIARTIEGFGLIEAAEKYRFGMKNWKAKGRCIELDRWIDNHWHELENMVFGLIAKNRDCLYDEN